MCDLSLIQISNFVLNLMLQRNVSKFAIFCIYENSKFLILFFIFHLFIFSQFLDDPPNYLGSWEHYLKEIAQTLTLNRVILCLYINDKSFFLYLQMLSMLASLILWTYQKVLQKFPPKRRQMRMKKMEFILVL